jgi:hypothetical protein
MKQITMFLALLSLLTLGASLASADTFTITSDHCSGTGGCLGTATSAGTISVTDVSSNVVKISVSLASGFTFHSGGQDVDFGFNLDPNQTITYSGLPSIFTLPGGGTTQSAGTLHADGFGDVEYGVKCTGDCTGSTGPSSLTFTITGTSLSASSLQFFVLDVFSAGTGNTGFVDATRGGTSVPDGGMTLMLLGGALAGLETLRRKLQA